MADKTIDVNTETDSSTVSTAVGEDTEVVNDSSASTTEQTTQTEASKGLLDAIKKGVESVAAAQPDGEETSTEKETEEGETEKETETETTEEEGQDKGPIPYERFAEVNTKAKQLEQQFEDVKPLLVAQRQLDAYCQAKDITADDFKFWLQAAALEKENPEEAWKFLEPRIKQMQALRGDVLPPDLQEAVDNGEIKLEYAKRLVASESRGKFTQRKAEQTREQFLQQENARYQQEVSKAYMNWVKTRQASDPDFKPSAGPNAALGRFEIVQYKLQADVARLIQEEKIKTVDDVIAYAESVYKQVNQSMKPASRKTATVGLRSNQSTSAPANTVPKSTLDAIKLGVSKVGKG